MGWRTSIRLLTSKCEGVIVCIRPVILTFAPTARQSVTEDETKFESHWVRYWIFNAKATAERTLEGENKDQVTRNFKRTLILIINNNNN